MLSSFPSKCMVLVFSYLLECNFTGAAMEINISHRSRQEILSTSDLARADLFHNALNEIVQLMKTVSFLDSKQFDGTLLIKISLAMTIIIFI
jgi:hypothetical protein